MKQLGVEAAKARLKRLQECISDLETVRTIEDTRTAWAHFLIAANGVYSKLEQAAKGNSQSEQWFARKNAERKNDELMQYLHQARNAEEHSIEGSDAAHAPYATAENQWTHVVKNGMDGEGIVATVEAGKKLALKMNGAGMHLLPVKNRGRVYDVPKSHLGVTFTKNTVGEIARLTENYLANLIIEAEGLASP